MDFKKLMRPHLKNVRPYVPGKPIEELRRERNFTGEIAKLASNENPYPPVREVIDAITAELGQLNRYPNSGSYYLCADLAEFLGVEPGRIFVGNGSNEIIDLLARAFINPTDEIVYPFPSFIVYPIVAQLMGVKAVEVPLVDYRLDLAAMKTAITPRTKIVFICNPNNPTGTYVTKDEVDRFLDGLRSDIIVAFDEAYYEFADAADFPDTIELLKSHPNIITLRTFSKIHSLSGLRVGYSISHPDLVTCLHMVRQPFNVNRIAQAAGRAALRHFDKTKERIGENRAQLEKVRAGLVDLGFEVPPSQTNFLLAVPPEGPGNLTEELMNRGIIVRDMSPFGLAGAMRVSIGTPAENERFLKTMRELIRTR
ncbi:MAG TPA: histidinol-phosphate transaminase [Candidatus Eisenbacteria bacterium]|uniref:Histidinol-phosphate aminotransferase n=1 Tax=Eiseniibacteriota bacterium TaxID=2212470 RepID=A0A7V2AUS6_UNCEI|nr:histidinol-phosphate transaminase [Candidatus Eisenbacteria bacterium]